MSEFLFEKYYDLKCEHCSRTRSEDYEKGFHFDKNDLAKKAHAEGWRVVDDKNICPICHKIHQDPAWKSVAVEIPPVIDNIIGFEGKTEKAYLVITKEGHTVRGHIYRNSYSCSGYAVYINDNYCFNNVTHWVPDETVWDEDK